MDPLKKGKGRGRCSRSKFRRTRPFSNHRLLPVCTSDAEALIMRLSTSIVVQGHSSSTKTTTRIETSSNETRSLVHLRSTTSSFRLEEPSAPSHEFSKGETRRLALPLTSYTKRTDTLSQETSALCTRRSVTIGTTVHCSDSKTKMAVRPTPAETRSLVQRRVVTSGGRSEALMATMFAKSGSSGLLETVSTLQDSRTGVRQLCHGRHIGDRWVRGTRGTKRERKHLYYDREIGLS